MMDEFQPRDPHFAVRVQESFEQQKVMHLIGAKLWRVEPGLVEILLPFRDDLTQQNGFLHAGIITTIVDSACGYAAHSLMPADADVLSVEFKVNMLRPARGDRFIAEARVIKAGRTLTVVRGDVYAQTGDESKLVATMLATMICR
ncbi:MAG: hypothetical protein QOH96_3455 [Blastocatellia bacterium]|nr:hypothetical protein [Blastocatellia bacterium]